MIPSSRKFFSFCVILLCCFNFKQVEAAGKKHKKVASVHVPVQTSIVVDGKTGKVLHADNATRKIYPASLTKVMTLYMLFEAIDSGKVKLSDHFTVSKNATTAKPCKLNLKAGEKITVEDAILALIVKSANDAAVTVAENLAGSEAKFSKLMNIRAKQLGMRDSHFTNASGWHHPNQVTTAVDLAKLSIAIKRDFPKYYCYFAQTSFNFKGQEINGHNRVTANYPGAEGLKTGFTNPAGRNLITTATRNGKNLVAVVTGSHSNAHRDQKMVSLLDKHFGVSSKTKPLAPAKKKKRNQTKVRLANNIKSSANR